ncbi:MAG: MBL fold metallo-hydrolase, partial [Verrucomicrobia bacterium]|nr:MBL fold metallo-hydrolase [Verrucomicrobiota bacterium]
MIRLPFLSLLLVASALAAEDAGRFTLTCLEIPDIGRGAGLALVLQTPGGRTYLYDTGSGYREKDGSWTGNHNSGRDLIAPFLKEHGIKALDGVIISHAHLDHFGGLLWMMENKNDPVAAVSDRRTLAGSGDIPVAGSLLGDKNVAPPSYVPIKKLFDPGYKFAGRSDTDYTSELGLYEKLREQFQKREGAYQAAHAGDKLVLDDRLDVEVLSPPKE